MRRIQRRRSPSRLITLGSIAIGLGVVAAAVATASSTSQSPDSQPKQGLFGGVPVLLSDCATTEFSVLLNGEVNTVYDSDTRILELSALGPYGVDVQFWVNVDDPVCLAVPALTKQIVDAVAVAEETLAADCTSVRQQIADPEKAKADFAEQGVTWTVEAAERFLAEACGG